MNIALENCTEHVDGARRRSYGDAFIRGNNGEFAFLLSWLLRFYAPWGCVCGLCGVGYGVEGKRAWVGGGGSAEGIVCMCVCVRIELTGFSDVHLRRLISRPACAGLGGCVMEQGGERRSVKTGGAKRNCG